MMPLSYPVLGRMMQRFGQDGRLLPWLVYLMPFSLLWVSTDLPFPFVTSKALLVTLSVLIGFIVMTLRRTAIRFTRFDLLLLVSILSCLLTGFVNGTPELSFYSTLERCNGVALQLILFLYLLLLRNITVNWRIYWSVIIAVSSIVWVDLLIRDGLHSELIFTSLFGNDAYVAGFLMLAALVSVWLGAGISNRWLRWALYCLGGIQGIIAVLTYNRSAITSLLLAIMTLYLLNFMRKSVRWPLWMVISIVLVGLLLLPVLFLDLVAFHDFAVIWDKSLRTGTISARFDLWRAAALMFVEAPLYGAGFGNFLFAFNRHHPGLYAKNPAEQWVDNAHSLPFEMLATTGVVGTLPWVIMLVALFVTGARRLGNHAPDKWLFVALLTCFIEQMFVINSIPKHIIQIGLMAYFTQNLPSISLAPRWTTRWSKQALIVCRSVVAGVCLYGTWHLVIAPYGSFREFNEIRFDSVSAHIRNGQVEEYFAKPRIYTLWPKLLLISDLEQTLQDGHAPVTRSYIATLIASIQTEILKDPRNVKAQVALGRLYLLSDPIAAEAVFQRVVLEAPNKPHSYYYLGFAQHLNGQARAAAASFRRCLDIDTKLIACDQLLRRVEDGTLPTPPAYQPPSSLDVSTRSL